MVGPYINLVVSPVGLGVQSGSIVEYETINYAVATTTEYTAELQ